MASQQGESNLPVSAINLGTFCVKSLSPFSSRLPPLTSFPFLSPSYFSLFLSFPSFSPLSFIYLSLLPFFSPSHPATLRFVISILLSPISLFLPIPSYLSSLLLPPLLCPFIHFPLTFAPSPLSTHPHPFSLSPHLPPFSH